MIDNIVDDIYNRMTTSKIINEDNLNMFLSNLKSVLKDSLEKERAGRKNNLRMSSIGKADRKIWMEVNGPEKSYKTGGQFLIRMLYGSIVEELLLFLVREAGHSVSDEQKEVHVNGVRGHIDCKIDEEVVDIKSASDYGFRKFKNGFGEEDDFGYIGQLSGYVEAEGKDRGYFLAMNKSTGEIALLEVDDFDLVNATDRIDKIRSILQDKDNPPVHCGKPVAEGTSGNKVLPRICNFCEYKKDCWPELRSFQYSRSIKHFTKIVKEPKVEEIFNAA